VSKEALTNMVEKYRPLINLGLGECS